MIVVDLEMSGLNLMNCAIWQIGAVELEHPENTFIDEGSIADSDLVEQGALKVIGKTEEQLRDKKKQNEKELLFRFFKWASRIDSRILVCQHPQADFAFLEQRAWKHGLDFPFVHRAFDLHSMAQMKYFELKGKFLVKGADSEMGLRNTLELVGMKDPRKAHNALEDAKLTAECFSRIVYGKKLIKEYFEFKLPEYLEKEGVN